MRPRLVLRAAALLCVGAVSTANAGSLVDRGAFTLDKATGLDWLDLTATTNSSFNQVTTQFGTGGFFEGYRYATVAEVRTFWVDAGLTVGTPQACTGSIFCYAETFPTGPTGPIAQLTGLMGNTWVPNFGFSGVIGLTSTLFDNCPLGVTCYVTPELRFSSDFAEAMVVEALRSDIADPSYGSWLVRTDPAAAAPEPSTWAMMILGFAGIGFLAYRRKSTVPATKAAVLACDV